MKYFFQLLVTAIGIGMLQTLQAQHNNAWFRATLSAPIFPKIKLNTEIQHRRQNSFSSSSLLDKSLMFTLRTWVHYQVDSGLKISASPLAYFVHRKIIQQKGDEITQPIREIRFSLATEWQHKIVYNLLFFNRLACEYRILSSTPTPIIRLRNRIDIRYPLVKNLQIAIFDEWIANVLGASTNHFFDHNRLGLSLSYTFGSRWTIESGYIHIHRLPLNDLQLLQENNFFLFFTYSLFKPRVHNLVLK